MMREYMRQYGRTICLCLLLTILYPAMHLLGGGETRELAYGLVLSLSLLLVAFAVSFLRYRARCGERNRAKKQPPAEESALPKAASPLEERWRLLVAHQMRERQQLMADMAAEEREKTDYYTLWLHQLKTPVAALDLMAQSNQPVDRPLMRQELTKISQYAGAALDYQRLTGIREDLQLTDVALYPLCCQQVKRLRPLFLYGQIALDMPPFDQIVLSDGKWLGVVIGQVLSNALKYTPPGGRITIAMAGQDILTVTDSGIGIRSEDVPRVFHRGFTGHTGRDQEKSTGIGLYLCKKICDLLGHDISLFSKVGEGTTVSISMSRQRLRDF